MTRSPFLDFCLWPYEPLASPGADALHGGDLLDALLPALDRSGTWRRAVAACRAELGLHATVWGLTATAAGPGLELYFYDYARLDRTVGASRVARLLAEAGLALPQVDERIPYFMCSVTLPALPGGPPALDIYIGNPGSAVSSGIAYAIERGGPRLKNFYFFFDRVAEWEDITGKLLCSAHLPLGSARMEELLPSWLADCRRVVVANKREADALYLSGLHVSALVRFISDGGFDADVRDGLAALAPRLGHLRFDVGYDFAAGPGGIVRTKRAFYGVL